MVEKALLKMNNRQRNYCEKISEALAKAREEEYHAEIGYLQGKLRGYLDCMVHNGVLRTGEIKKMESDLLYMHFNYKYTNENRRKEKE